MVLVSSLPPRHGVVMVVVAVVVSSLPPRHGVVMVVVLLVVAVVVTWWWCRRRCVDEPAHWLTLDLCESAVLEVIHLGTMCNQGH